MFQTTFSLAVKLKSDFLVLSKTSKLKELSCKSLTRFHRQSAAIESMFFLSKFSIQKDFRFGIFQNFSDPKQEEVKR